MLHKSCLHHVLLPLLLITCCAGEAAPPASSGWQLVTPYPKAAGSVTLSLKARQEVKGWQKTAVPVLTVECARGKPAVYVETGLPLEVTDMDKQIVRMRFDDNGFVGERWQEVTNATVSSRDAGALIEKLGRSRIFVIEFTPFSSPPVQAEFAVQGLSGYLVHMDKACLKK